MPAKRPRLGDASAEVQARGTATANGKPLSAVAAARLRAEAAARDVVALSVTPPPVHVSGPASPPPHSPELGHEGSDQDKEPSSVRQTIKLCTWRNAAQNILSDTDAELTLELNKHSTIALIGCFRFKVLRGAINVNGANIGTISHNGAHDGTYTAYVPATHPITKFRGLDGVNHTFGTEDRDPEAPGLSLLSCSQTQIRSLDPSVLKLVLKIGSALLRPAPLSHLSFLLLEHVILENPPSFGDC
ncbi:Polynucleotide 5'-hydroxyl-kinase grc3 [Pleosporales sp. CAS-2024a]